MFVTEYLPGKEEAIRRTFPVADWRETAVPKVRNTQGKEKGHGRGGWGSAPGLHRKEPGGGASRVDRVPEVLGKGYPEVAAS